MRGLGLSSTPLELALTSEVDDDDDDDEEADNGVAGSTK